MAAAKINQEDGPCCPICLEQFRKPRQLPCVHSFCEKCLQSHIDTEATKCTKLRNVQCPVCGNSSSPSIKGASASEWASLFPANTVLQSVLDRLCDACTSEGVSVPAKRFCVECEEAICEDCLNFHRKQKLLKDHTILGLEELTCNPENVMKFAGFTCSEHDGEDIKYYCKDHKVPCCGTCFFRDHKMCSKVIDLKEDLPALLCDSKPDEIIADMKKIEIHLNKFVEINEASVNDLESQINRMTEQIREVRKKIDSVLEELEKRVRTEGNIIYKEEVTRKQEENKQCLSLIHAVRNSCYQFEAVHKYGSNLQKFLIAEKMRSQLHSCCNLVGEKYEKTHTVTVEVKFAPTIESILSLPLSELVKFATTTRSNTLPLECLRRPTKACQVEIIDVIGPKATYGNSPRYAGVTCLPGYRVMLADYCNNQCILLSSSYQFINSRTLTGHPCSMCVLDDQEVAVSLYNQNKIEILSVVGDVIMPVRTITTKNSCNAIAAAKKGEMVLSGDCGNNNSHWSLINTRGDVKYTYQYNSPYYHYNYLVLDSMKTRVYVSVYSMHSLLCFDMNGRKQFKYRPVSLRGPRGLAVDRCDNIYVVGYLSHNIHQLSPNGSVLHVISSGVPKYPWAICIHKSKDSLIVTNASDERKLCIYQLK